jgi:hypothetical protein
MTLLEENKEEEEGGRTTKSRRLPQGAWRQDIHAPPCDELHQYHRQKVYENQPQTRRTRTYLIAAMLMEGDGLVPGICDHLHVAFDFVSFCIATVTCSELYPPFYYGLGDGVLRLLLPIYDVRDIRILAATVHPSTSSLILCHIGLCRPQP